MSLAELKESVLALPEKERHDLFVWLNRLEASQGDIPSAPPQDEYFASDYPLPEDRLELEAAMAPKHRLERTKAEALRAIRKSKLTFTRSWETMRHETREL